MKELKWYVDTEWAWSDMGINKAKVWRAAYHGKEGTFDLEVYPVKLIHKDLKGWEYKIIGDNGEEYDSYAYSNGNDHAPTAKNAMEWAEAELGDILEEKRAEAQKAKA